MRFIYPFALLFSLLACQAAAPDTGDDDLHTPISTATSPSLSATPSTNNISPDTSTNTATAGTANDSIARLLANIMCNCPAIRQSAEINHALKSVDAQSPQYSEMHQQMMALIPAIETCTKPLDAAYAAMSIPDQMQTSALSDKYCLQLCPELAAKFNKQ